MKPFSHAFCGKVLLATFALFASQCLAAAQTISFPIVTIHVSDPIAMESGNPAAFEVDRQGPTNSTLNIYYDIGGTASNGVDYTEISHFVTIPAGARSASIVIKPLEDTNVEGTETVILQLAPSPMMNPVNYIIGSPSNAVAYIFDDDTGSNSPPAVNIVAPRSGAVFQAPADIQLLAQAIDVDGTIQNVEFFAGSQDLGHGNVVVLDPPGVNGVVGPIYILDWTNAPPGKYSLTAVATDNSALSTTSSPVDIKVLSASFSVKITSPTNGATFVAPVDIPISATANSSNTDVVRVDFFADDHFIGTDSGTNKAHYDMVWSNSPPGFYYLRAVAVDSFGATGASDVVRIAIIGITPPPPQPLVSIYATDPIAVVGTNCLSCYSNRPVADLNFRSVTNSASFVVRRSGDTNASLVVNYSTSGTASNGVDYATLPGSVTIPAGRRFATIVIHPLNEGGVECPETVVLTLQQSTTVPPPYVAAWPDKAEAVIIDCNFPPPATHILCDGAFHFCFPPVSNAAFYRLECSMDMIHWLPVCTNTSSEIGIHFTDPQAQNFPSLFYRVVPQADAPVIYP